MATNLISTNFSGGVFEKAAVAGIVSETTTTTPQLSTQGQVSYLAANTTNYVASTYTTSGKTVIAFQDEQNGYYGPGKAIVVTTTGDNITYGAPVVFDSGDDSDGGNSIGYDTVNNKLLIGHGVNNNHRHRMVVGTVSGTTTTWGTAVDVESGNSAATGAFRPQGIVWVGGVGGDTTNRLVMAYEDQANDGGARVVTISGTTPTAGVMAEFTSATPRNICMAYVGGGQIVVAWTQTTSLYMRPGTVTGGGTNTIEWGVRSISLSSTASGAHDMLAIAYDEQNDKILLTFRGPSNRPYYLTAFVTGTGASAECIFTGALQLTSDGGSSAFSAVYHAAVQKILISYKTSANSGNWTAIAATYSSTVGNVVTYTFGTPTVLGTGVPDMIASSYDSLNKRALLFRTNTPKHSSAAVADSYGIAVDLLSSTLTLDLTTGNYLTVDLQSNGTSNIDTITAVPATAAPKTLTFNLKVTQGSVPRQFVWSGSTLIKFKWQRYWLPGTGWVHRPTNTLANDAVDVYSFTTYDNGVTWYSSIVGQNIS